jgi:hypothetical protein
VHTVQWVKILYEVEFLIAYTGSLAPADFSGVVFAHAHFQNIALIYSLCDFPYTSEGIPSLLLFWLLMSAVDLVRADFC